MHWKQQNHRKIAMHSGHKILSWETQTWEKTEQLFLRRIQANKYITINMKKP
jgi:hypothetical protein